MRFFETTVVKYAVVETDVYTFRVNNVGVMNRWCEETSNWTWFDRDKFTEEELAMVQAQGLAALEMV